MTWRARMVLVFSGIFFPGTNRGLGIEAARRRFQKMSGRARKPTPVAAVENRFLPGPAGEIPVRVYTPDGPGPFPVFIYLHGGAFVLADLDTEDETCRVFCRELPGVVVSVGYRLAPEHKFPAAPDDCLAATRWVRQHARELKGDPERIAIGGQSAGGHLAAVTALGLRDEAGPKLRGQILVNASTDYHTPATPSCLAFASGCGLTRDDIAWAWELYLRDPSDANDPRAAPLRAPDLGRMPPALVITAEFDPLRDEGESYAARLREAGGEARVSRYSGMIHGFFHFRQILPEGRQAMREAIEWLRTVFLAPATREPPGDARPASSNPR